jgi:hypothetical protein
MVVDGAVDDPGLEAGVSIAKRYRGCHDHKIVIMDSAITCNRS